jgi:subtilisin family serine protease
MTSAIVGLLVSHLTGLVAASSPSLAPSPIISSQITQTSGDISVIVQLGTQPAAIGKYAAAQGIQSLAKTATEANVQTEQAQFLEEATDSGLSLKVNYQYDTVLNGFEVTLPADQLADLAKLPGVKAIDANRTWYPIPIEPSSSENDEFQYDSNPLKQIGADQAWAKNLTGAGLKVGVIDTGIDYTHPDIAPIYKGGYDSFYQDNDPYEEVPLTAQEDPFNVGYKGTYHGTHVAGTIIGQFANQESEIVQKGVAYNASLYAYKVLGRDLEQPDRSSGSSAQVIDGIERAVKDGMDVINLSLGSDSEKNVNSPDAIAINNAVLAGVVAVVANGNAGPGHYTMGSPASSQLAISVGAVTSEEQRFSGQLSASFSDNDGNLDEEGNPDENETTPEPVDFKLLGWETAKTDFSAILGTEKHEVVYVGLGDKSDYENKDVQGKIVLASRGKLAFVDKIINAKQHGATAIVIFNGKAAANQTDADLTPSLPNLDGFINLNVGDSFDYIPAFDIQGAVGRSLANQLIDNENAEKTLSITFPSHYEQDVIAGDRIADFTSWGPNADAKLSIKPDITAPGVNILSTYPAYGKNKEGVSYAKAYARLNGTSMATPHVAGLALLLKQQHPDWTPFDVRAALANTSDLLSDEDGHPYDVFKQGAGRANVAKAIETPALLQAIEPITILDKNYNRQQVNNYNSSTSFGVVGVNQELTKKLQLKNTSAQNVDYTASIQWFGGNGGIEATLSDGTILANEQQTKEFTLNVKTPSEAAEGFYQGQIKLENPQLPTLHLPFSIYVGQEKPNTGFGVQDLALSKELIYPKRTNQDKAELSFKLSAENTNYYILEILNLHDETIGYYEEKFSDSPSGFFKPDTYTYKDVSDVYHPYDEEGNPILGDNGKPKIAHLQEGQYRINVVAAQLDEDGQLVYEGTKAILYKGFIAFRIDPSPTPDPGGNPGGEPNQGGNSGSNGNGGSGGGNNLSSPPKSEESQNVTPVEKTVIPQGYKQHLIIATEANVKGNENGNGNPSEVGNVNQNVSNIGEITDAQLKEALEANKEHTTAYVIRSPFNTNNKDINPSSNIGVTDNKLIQISLSAEQLKLITALKEKPLLVISSGKEAVALPSTLLSLAPKNAGLKVTLGTNKDLTFKGKIPKQRTLVGDPVSFRAEWTTANSNQPTQLSTNLFIKRAWLVAEEIKANQAGVLVQAGEQISAIPSFVEAQEDHTTIVSVNHPGWSTYVLAQQKIGFTDISISWAESHIKALAHKFIIEGTSQDKFSPTASLTRAQFTALLVRSLGLTASSPNSTPTSTSAKQANFSDVPSTAWYAKDVATAYEAGLIQGMNATKFAPDTVVTRQDLAVLLARALELTGVKLQQSNPSLHTYSDSADIQSYAKDSINLLSQYGVIDGNTNNKTKFDPQKPATRETAAGALHLLLRGIKFVE